MQQGQDFSIFIKEDTNHSHLALVQQIMTNILKQLSIQTLDVILKI